jgi:hypothetical protein
MSKAPAAFAAVVPAGATQAQQMPLAGFSVRPPSYTSPEAAYYMMQAAMAPMPAVATKGAKKSPATNNLLRAHSSAIAMCSSSSFLSVVALLSPDTKRKMEEDDFSGDEGGGGKSGSKKVRSGGGGAGGAGAGRFSSSLGVLTQKFIELWQKTSQLSELDLNEASKQLEVAKRRIYDITNVLEGIGLISKKSKNLIQWKGQGGLGPMIDQRREILTLKEELEALSQEEQMIDDYIAHMQETVNFTHAFESNAAHCYMTYEDIRSIPDFQQKVLIAVKAPKGTKLDVPELSELNLQDQHPYQVIMTSPDGPVEIFVVSQDQVDRREEDGQQHPDANYIASGASSPMHPLRPPMSPVMSTTGDLAGQHAEGGRQGMMQAGTSVGGGLGMTSVPSSPFPIHGGGGSSWPYNLASPGYNHQQLHPGIPGGARTLLHSADHHPLSHLHPSHSPTPLAGASRLNSPALSRIYSNTHSPYHGHTSAIGGGMVFRPGMMISGSPLLSSVGGGAASAGGQSIGGVMKLEPPSNDPDYYMNLDADEGLTDLYSNHRATDI